VGGGGGHALLSWTSSEPEPQRKTAGAMFAQTQFQPHGKYILYVYINSLHTVYIT